MNGRAYTEIVVILGLLHYLIPISALTLLGTLQNINPRLTEAAQALGAPRWRAHLTITVPLSVPGLLSAFLICFTLCLSAFVVPLILGKGKVLFLSDGNGEFTKAVGFDFDGSGIGLGTRSMRYAMLVDDGVVRLVQARWGPA